MDTSIAIDDLMKSILTVDKKQMIQIEIVFGW